MVRHCFLSVLEKITSIFGTPQPGLLTDSLQLFILKQISYTAADNIDVMITFS